jgi:hypothetical protein
VHAGNGTFGAADQARAHDLADLSDDGTNRAGRGGNHQGFTGPQRGDVGESVVGGDAAHAAGAEQGGQRNAGIGEQAHIVLGALVQDQIVLPARDTLYQVAYLVQR